MDTLLKLETLYDRKEHISALLNLINRPIKTEKSNNDSPIMIHVIGQESKIKLQRSYICTALRQIETANKLGIPNDRIYIIYGEAVPKKKEEMTCEFSKTLVSPHHMHQPLQKDINIKYVPSEGTFDEVLTKILSQQCTSKTPIIFGYDGHGYTVVAKTFSSQHSIDSIGNMPLYDSHDMTNDNLTEIFRKTNRMDNNKLFLWTQCGSYDFLKRIEDKNELLGFHVASTKGSNECGLGSGIMREFSWKFLQIQFGSHYDSNPLKLQPPPNIEDLTFANYEPYAAFYSVLLPKTLNKNTKMYEYLGLTI